MPACSSLQSKKIATVVVVAAVFLSGITFQYAYHVRARRYRSAIAGYYRQYFHREPDEIGLTHWTTWALNKWGLKKVERIGFVEAKKKGAV